MPARFTRTSPCLRSFGDRRRYNALVMTSARFAFLLTFLAAANLHAQSVAGVATDASGSAIPGVTVTATPAGREGGAAVAVTDMAGAFHLTGLKPGAYEIEATLDGFQTIARKVTLVTGQAL